MTGAQPRPPNQSTAMTLKIAHRLWLPTAAMAIAMLALAAAISVGLRSGGEIASADERQRLQDARLLDASTWHGLVQAQVMGQVASLLGPGSTAEAALRPAIDASSGQIAALQSRIQAAPGSDDDQAALGRIHDARQAYAAASSALLAAQASAAGSSDSSRSRALFDSQVQPAINAYLASQQGFLALQQQHRDAVRADAVAERLHTLSSAVGLLALLVLGMAVGTALQVRAICTPIQRLADIARRIGEGDLDVEVDTRRSDEIGAVNRSLASMRDALRGIVGQVRQAAESIQVASSEVASGNADLSQRTEQAASQLQQTASALAQLTGHVRQSADAAAQAKQLAASASAVAQRGGAVVGQVVSTMDEINRSSKRIADIVGTIDGIAFQTNILALNAAVEAARAGEQGRGFAVVASEVRSLAQRSADAAREIKGLIGASVDKVATGARLVQSAGSTMGEIVASVQRVGDIIGEISAAAAEQSSGIGLVNGTVASLDQMTQQNAALVEQSAAAAESLREQAERLSVSMQVFRLSGGPGGGPAGAVAGWVALPVALPVAVPVRMAVPILARMPMTGPLSGPVRVAVPQARPAAAVAPARPLAAPPRLPGAAAPQPVAAAAPADSAEWESF